MMKLSENMARTLVRVAEQGRTIAWGRDQASAKALDARGLVKIVGDKIRNGGVAGDTGKDGLRVEITDAGFELALELV